MTVRVPEVKQPRAVRGVLAASILLVLIGWFVWTTELAERVELWLHGEQPIQFYLSLNGDLLDDYSRVFGVAHNSGDRIATTREALEHGADVIEIDVVSVGNNLYAAHETPPWFVYEGIYQGPRLEAAWFAASESPGAKVIKLDLKERTPLFIDLVIEFLNRRADRTVIVSTDHRPTLEALRERAPHAYRFLSTGTRDRLDGLYGDADLVALLDGVAIRETLVDDESAAWLQDHGLLMLAWTVNDIDRMNQLVKLGVNGITTDNLAILEFLGSQKRDVALLSRTAFRPID